MFRQLLTKYWTWRDNGGDVVHTIVWARIKLTLGMTFTAVQQSGVDIASIVSQDPIKQAAVRVGFAWLAIDGTLSEWARRHNADDIGSPSVPPIPPVPPVPPVTGA